MKFILIQIWTGLWTGFGVELSVLLLYVLWKLAHSRLAHRIHADHWFHKIDRYFD